MLQVTGWKLNSPYSEICNSPFLTVLLMAFVPGDDGSVFPNSAQDVYLVIDDHYILKKKKDTRGSRA